MVVMIHIQSGDNGVKMKTEWVSKAELGFRVSMAEIAFDVFEQILIRLDVKDVIRCKSVCKSWQSFISSSRFVKAHLNATYNNDHKHRKLVMRKSSSMSAHELFYAGSCYIVGSSNGLVCISPFYTELLVTNPSTREVKELQLLPEIPNSRSSVCWGFGYDSSTDDYKVIAGSTKGNDHICFYVLTLKSNFWKLVREMKYTFISDSRRGILCDGSLYWFMNERCNRYKKKKVILSFDLSREEFKEISRPDGHDDLSYYAHRLGIVEECLCIYNYESLSSNKWVMKNYGVKQSWELLPEMEYCVAQDLTTLEYNPYKNYAFCQHDGIRLVCNEDYITAPIFVESLVSPHVREGKPRQRKSNAKVVKKEVKTIGLLTCRKIMRTSVSKKRKRMLAWDKVSRKYIYELEPVSFFSF